MSPLPMPTTEPEPSHGWRQSPAEGDHRVGSAPATTMTPNSSSASMSSSTASRRHLTSDGRRYPTLDMPASPVVPRTSEGLSCPGCRERGRRRGRRCYQRRRRRRCESKPPSGRIKNSGRKRTCPPLTMNTTAASTSPQSAKRIAPLALLGVRLAATGLGKAAADHVANGHDRGVEPHLVGAQHVIAV
jgi:hypothetical protein